MINFLIIFVVALFLLSYYSLGQDVFQPSCLVTASYIVSVLCAYINQDIWGVELHANTVIVICSGLLVFYFVNLIIHSRKRKLITNKHKSRKVLCSEEFNIDNPLFVIVIIGQLFALLIYYREVIRITGGGINFSSMMTAFRIDISYSTGKSVSALAGQLSKISLICADIFLFIFLNNIVERKKKSKRYLLPVIIYIIQAVLTGGRFNILALVFSGLIMFNIIWHRKYGWKQTLNLKVMMRIVVVVCILFMAFYWGRALVGRQNDSDLLTYLSSYAGGSIPLLDMYLNNPIDPSEIWGKETFYSLLGDLKQLGLVNFQDYIIHLEFRSSNGIVIGNVYTAFRRHIQDFGFVGMIILQIIWSGIMSFWYKQIKYHVGNIGIIIYAMTAYPLFMHSINDYFFMDKISIGYMVTLVMTIVIYKIVTAVKFR